MSRAELDLKLAAGIAILAILTATTVDATAARVAPAVLLVLVLPGYALSVALLPEPRDVLERCLLAVGLSFCVGVLGGLLVDRLGVGLTSRSWSVALAAFTLTACAVAHRRRAAAGIVRLPAVDGWRLPVSRRLLSAAAVTAAALAAVVAAILIARSPSGSAHVRGYAALWIVPSKTGAGAFSVGVRSEQLRTTSYRLVATSVVTGNVLFRRSLTLAPGREAIFDGRVALARNAGFAEVAVSLYRTARPQEVYRHVLLTFESPGP